MFILNIYTFRCLALPWLIFSMLEILILGCPAVIFFSLLGIYLYIQVHLYTRHYTCISRYTYILGIYLYIQVHLYTWHLPVYPGTLLYLASTCISRYTSILGIYLYIQAHLYTRDLQVYPGILIYSAYSCLSRYTYILGIYLYL